VSEAPDLLALVRCACFNTRAASRAVTQHFDRVLEPSGVRSTQFAMLAVVRAAGSVAMQALAAHLHLDPSTLTRTLQPLEKEGLLRVEDGQDRRSKDVVLTAAGHRKVVEAYALWKIAQDEIARRIGPARLESLVTDLAALTSALR
jgi:DNA-binding MarR family transcriptional regulator